MRVVVVGAGIGGLTLAHALRRPGIAVTVVERDTAAAGTDGYRLHLRAAAKAAVRRCCPAAGWRSSRPRLRDVHPVLGARPPRRGAAAHSRSAGRRSDDRPPAAARDPGGRVEVRWGTPVVDPGAIEADVLVGADGVRSVVTPLVTGRPASRPAGVTAIAGTVRLDGPARPPVPAALDHGPAFAIGPGGVGLFLARGADAGGPPYVVWSIAAPEAGAGGLADAAALIRSWSSRYHRLLDATEPGSVAAFPFHVPAALGPWPSDRVTLIGDAIHPMPPTAGAGASTAIVDAVHLADDLATHPVPEAPRRYQARMLGLTGRAGQA